MLNAIYNVPIRQSVRQNFTIVSPSDSIFTVAEKMVRDDIGAVIVIEENKPVGILTEKDILERVILPKKKVSQTLVQDVLTKSLISIDVDCSIENALELMKKNNVRRLIVTEKGTLFGLVTERRLLNLLTFRIADLLDHLEQRNS
jgi:CBS domain-containing protein